MKESIIEYQAPLSIDVDAVSTMLRGNLRRWETHLASTRLGEKKKDSPYDAIENFVVEETQELQVQKALSDLYENTSGRYNRIILPFTMKNVRKLPIVGDVFYERK